MCIEQKLTSAHFFWTVHYLDNIRTYNRGPITVTIKPNLFHFFLQWS